MPHVPEGVDAMFAFAVFTAAALAFEAEPSDVTEK
jgi:hypothetical protein